MKKTVLFQKLFSDADNICGIGKSVIPTTHQDIPALINTESKVDVNESSNNS